MTQKMVRFTLIAITIFYLIKSIKGEDGTIQVLLHITGIRNNDIEHRKGAPEEHGCNGPIWKDTLINMILSERKIFSVVQLLM